MKKYLLLFFFILLCVPWYSHAEPRINEIAWQGYLGDANNEWIEIYNDAGDFSLDGWLLEAEDGTPSINLSGLSVGSGDFLLLERTDDSSVPEETADKTYSGALSNEGEKLILKNSDGQIIDTADFSSGWDMDSASLGTKSFFSSWGLGEPTPRASNISLSGEEDENDTVLQEEPEEETTEDSETSSGEENQKVYKERKLVIEAPKFAFTGTPFSVASYIRDLDGDEIRKGLYAWNMGDGTVLYKGRNEEFSYVYQYPGDYVITLAYNKAAFGKEFEELEPLVYGEHSISVLDKTLTIEKFLDDGTIVLKNNSTQPMNLEGWILSNNDVRFTVLPNTIVRAGKTITFPGTVTNISHNPVFVFNPTGGLVDHSNKEKNLERESSSQQEERSETALEEESSYVEEEIFSLEGENLTASVASHGNQKTLSLFLFVSLFILVLVLIWFLLSSHKQQKTIVEGYEIVED